MSGRRSAAVELALQYHAAGMSVRAAAALAGCAPSSLSRAKQPQQEKEHDLQQKHPGGDGAAKETAARLRADNLFLHDD